MPLTNGSSHSNFVHRVAKVAVEMREKVALGGASLKAQGDQ